MAIPDPSQELRRPNLTSTNFIGKVIDVNDPEKRQRVKLRIPQLHRGVPDNLLPWTRPSSSQGGANAGAGAGSVRVPPKGATLYGNLEGNDPHNIHYGGSPTIDSAHKDNEILNEDYPHTFGEVDHAGNKTVTNTQKNTKTYVHKSGTTIHISADGSVSISTPKDVNVSAKAGINVAADGNINIHAKGALNLKGAPILFNGAGAPNDASSITARTRPNIPDPAGKERD